MHPHAPETRERACRTRPKPAGPNPPDRTASVSTLSCDLSSRVGATRWVCASLQPALADRRLECKPGIPGKKDPGVLGDFGDEGIHHRPALRRVVVARYAHGLDHPNAELAGNDRCRHQAAAGDADDRRERAGVVEPPGERTRIA